MHAEEKGNRRKLKSFDRAARAVLAAHPSAGLRAGSDTRQASSAAFSGTSAVF